MITAERKHTSFGRAVLLVMEKNLRNYANKPPVLIFGVLFPLFMFLSFYLGRNVDFYRFFPGLFAMSLFFLSSSIGPLITPWEKITRTYERLLAFPLTIRHIILGDIMTGLVYGTVLSGALLAIGLILIDYQVQVLALTVGMLAGAFCFASLGVVFSSPPVPNPSYTMIMASLIRFPLIFISGIFVPLADLSGLARGLSYISPITYLVDLMNYSLKGEFALHPLLDMAVLALFSILFCILAHKMQRRNMIRGF